jgi:hypothetical protein
LAIDPSNPNTLYAGTRFNGVFKTVNGGGSWTSVNPALGSTLFAIVHLPLVTDPLDSGTVYAGTSNGVFKSTDGGMNWTGVNNGLPALTGVFALAIEELGGAATIAVLIEQVESLNLNPGVKNSLVAKLNAAQESLERENANAARNQLQAFINQIRAVERSGRLDSTTAGQLISAAQAIIDSI